MSEIIEICISFTQFPPMALSCITIAQYHNQKIDIDTIHKPYSDFINFTYAPLWVYVYFVYIVLCRFDHHHQKQTTMQFHHKDPSFECFIVIIISFHLLPLQCLVTSNLFSCFVILSLQECYLSRGYCIFLLIIIAFRYT